MQVKLISQSSTKSLCADLIRAAKKANGWSNIEAAEALGCSEGTIRNRLDDDDAKEQMTVHELRRLVAHCDALQIADALGKLGIGGAA